MIDKKEVSTEIFSSFNELLSVCNLDHLKTCMCQGKLLRKLYRDSYKKHVVDILKLADNKNLTEEEKDRLKESGIDTAKKEAFSNTAKFCVSHNIRCPTEKREITKTINIFNNKYDLKDPRVYFTVKAVLNHQLSAYRMQKYSNEYGVVQEQHDRDGNLFLKINPVEDAKRKFDAEMIKAIATLDNMIEGQKVTNFNYDVVDADELFGEAQEKEVRIEYRVIE